jgi:uncharacterized OB-fold protein
MMAEAKKYPAPVTNPETAHFWEAAKAGKFMIKRYTFSLMRKSATGPYAIAYVTLKEGPSLQTNIVDCELDKLKIGQKVKVVFKPTDGAPLPFFTPA